MRMPRDLSAQELTELLKIYGYQITRQTGSHLRLTTTRKGGASYHYSETQTLESGNTEQYLE